MANVNGRVSAVVCLTIGMFVRGQPPARRPGPDRGPRHSRRDGGRRRHPLDPAAARAAHAGRRSSFRSTSRSPPCRCSTSSSTQQALAGGGVEGNPVMSGIVGSPVAMTALKVGATAGIVLLSEKVRKRNPVAAVVMMVTLNSAYAMVVSQNFAIARR